MNLYHTDIKNIQSENILMVLGWKLNGVIYSSSQLSLLNISTTQQGKGYPVFGHFGFLKHFIKLFNNFLLH